MGVLIAAFEVAPGDDEPFLAAARALPPPAGATLHRALRADVALRFVAFAPDAAGWDGLPFPEHAAVYEVEREDGDVDGAGGAVLIDFFAAGGERLVTAWERVRALFAQRQGYLGARLFGAAGAAGFPVVAVVRWSSPLMYARALEQPDVREAIAALPDPGRPALYLVVPTPGR